MASADDVPASQSGCRGDEDAHLARASSWRPIGVLAVTLFAIGLGSRTDFSLGLLLAAGMLALCFPPERRVSAVILWITGSLAFLGLAAYLPFSLFQGAQPWREALTQEFGMDLGKGLTPQPWVTAEHAVLFIGSLAVGGLFGQLRLDQRTVPPDHPWIDGGTHGPRRPQPHSVLDGHTVALGRI